MTDPEANQPRKRDSCSDFSLDRERRRIQVMKFAVGLFGVLLLLSLIITLVMNQ